MAGLREAAQQGDVIEVLKGEVRYTLGPGHPPVARVAPGTRLRIETELNIGDVLHSPGDRFGALGRRRVDVRGARSRLRLPGFRARQMAVPHRVELGLGVGRAGRSDRRADSRCSYRPHVSQ